jgi:hypothetical protein
MKNTQRKNPPRGKGEEEEPIEKGVRLTQKEYRFEGFLPNCKVRYKLLKPHIICVTKHDAITCHYPSRGAYIDYKSFACSIKGKGTKLEKLFYLVVNNIDRIRKDENIYQICGDPLCCKISHLVRKEKGYNMILKGCKGYIKLDEIDPTGERIFVRLCKHNPPCRVVTTLDDLDKSPEHNYPDAIKYKDKLYYLGEEHSGCVVTEINDDVIFSKKDIDDNDKDYIENLEMPVEQYFKDYDINNLDDIEYYPDRESGDPLFKGDNPDLLVRKQKKKRKKVKTFLEKCEEQYDLIKPYIVHVKKHEACDIICDYPSKEAKLSKSKSFTCEIDSKQVPLHRIVYHVLNNTETIHKLTEVHRICGDRLCCRPNHLGLGCKGSDNLRCGCKGFIELDELDSEDEPIFIKVCTHSPPCCSVTKFEDLECIDSPGKGEHADCPGSLKYHDKLYRLCNKGCCKKITYFTDDMICTRHQVNQTKDDHISDGDPVMDVENYFKTFNINKLPPIDKSDSDDSDDSDAKQTPKVKKRKK